MALTDRSSATFWLVDDDGDRLRIDPGYVAAQLPLEDVSKHPKVTQTNATLAAYLEGHLVGPRYGLADGNSAFSERLVVAGQRIGVFGLVSEERMIPTAGERYRDNVASCWRIVGTHTEPLVVRRG